MKKQSRKENFAAAKRLIESHVAKGVCSECSNPGVWLGETLPFRVYYVDGDFRNEAPENLQIMCPNCFSLTDQSDYGKQGE